MAALASMAIADSPRIAGSRIAVSEIPASPRTGPAMDTATDSPALRNRPGIIASPPSTRVPPAVDTAITGGHLVIPRRRSAPRRGTAVLQPPTESAAVTAIPSVSRSPYFVLRPALRPCRVPAPFAVAPPVLQAAASLNLAPLEAATASSAEVTRRARPTSVATAIAGEDTPPSEAEDTALAAGTAAVEDTAEAIATS